MTHAPAQTPVTAPVKAPSNGLATASLVLGIIGVVLALVPFLGVVGALVGGVGLVLAVFGLLASRKHGVGKGKAIAGLVLGVASIVVFLVVSAATIFAVDSAVKSVDKEISDRTDTSAATDVSDKDELADATIGAVDVNKMFGTVEVKITLTNSSPNRSDYSSNVVFESPDGTTQYGSSYLFVEGLEPGQTKVEKVMMLDELPAAAKKISVRLTDFDRSESF